MVLSLWSFMRCGQAQGNCPVVINETQVGAGAPAPLASQGLGGWREGKQDHPVTLPALLPWPTPTSCPRVAATAPAQTPPVLRGFCGGCCPVRPTHGLREGWYTCRSKGCVLVLWTHAVTLWPVHLLALASVFVRQSVQYTSPPYSVTAKRVRQELVSPKHLHVTGAVVTGRVNRV